MDVPRTQADETRGKLNFIDLFAGAGGLSCGSVSAGAPSMANPSSEMPWEIFSPRYLAR